MGSQTRPLGHQEQNHDGKKVLLHERIRTQLRTNREHDAALAREQGLGYPDARLEVQPDDKGSAAKGQRCRHPVPPVAESAGSYPAADRRTPCREVPAMPLTLFAIIVAGLLIFSTPF